MSAKRPDDEGRLLQLVYYLYVAFSVVARWMPERIAYGLANTIGTLQARRARKRTSQVERNLARVTGLPLGSDELYAVVAEAHRSYARYWLETFRAVRADARFFLERVRAEGTEHVQKQLDAGSGSVVLIGHLGTWDAAGAWAGAVGWKVVTVAETLRPRRLFGFFVAHRQRLGLTIHAAEKGVTAKLVDAVEAGAVVPILGDRDLKGTGVEVSFFGETATFPRGPAALALRTGVPIVFAGIRGERRDGRWGWALEISPPMELPPADDPDAVDRLTRDAVQVLEDFVARYPAEWHVFQPFWVVDRRPPR